MQPPRVSLSAASSVKSHRKLHTAFWAHGAALAELFDACQTLAGADAEPGKSAPSQRRQTETETPSSLMASTFPLDFLYPNGANALLQRLSPRMLSRGAKGALHQDKSRVPRSNLTSSAASWSSSRPSPPIDAETFAAELKGEGGPAPPSDRIKALADSVTLPESYNLAADENRPLIPDVLRHLLSSNQPEKFDHVWALYERLDSSLKDDLRVDILVYLGRSDRWTEHWRVKELFSAVDADQWTEPAVNAAIKANLTLNDVASATQIFNQAVELHGMARGLDLKLAHAFRSSSWPLALEIWSTFRSKFGPETRESVNASLEAVGDVPDLSAALSEFYRFVDAQGGADVAEHPREHGEALVTYVLGRTLRRLEPASAAFLVERVGTYLEYEGFINLCMDRGHKKLAARMYRRYRQLPGVRVRVFVLRHMLSVFYPHDAHGMEQVLRDWYQRYERLDSFAYRKYISFYAGRGDRKTVRRLTDEYRKHYPAGKGDRVHLASRMHPHAVRGDVEGARQVLESSRETRGQEAGAVEWNVLLLAHVKAWDVAGAAATFGHICEAGMADRYSFGTYMNMLGARGDVKLCLELYEEASRRGIRRDTAMADAVVEAYCQSERFDEAEAFCSETTEEGAVQGDYVYLWNTLLAHYARRRDLPNVNRILERMGQLGVTYDSQTYEHLLEALAHNKQGHHALRMMRVATEEGVFEATPRHYLQVMSAFIRSHEPHMALEVSETMDRLGFPMTADRTTAVIDALGRWREIPARLRQGRDVEYYRQAALEAFEASLGGAGRNADKDGDAATALATADPRAVTRQYAQIMFVLTHMGDFAGARRVLASYEERFPEAAGPRALPLRLLSAAMLADFNEGKLDQVRATWELMLERERQAGKDVARREGGDKGRAGGVPWSCYLLCDPLKTMQRTLVAQGDADGLARLVLQVRKAGFELNGKNWNYYVQGLARLGQQAKAFAVCERALMPQWTGWARVRKRRQVKVAYAGGENPESGDGGDGLRLPLGMRRLGSSPRHARPIAYTLQVLAREYRKMEQMAPWSRAGDRLFAKVNDSYPKTVHAVRTMLRLGSDIERRIFADEDQLSPWAEDNEDEDDYYRGSDNDYDLWPGGGGDVPSSALDVLESGSGLGREKDEDEDRIDEAAEKYEWWK